MGLRRVDPDDQASPRHGTPRRFGALISSCAILLAVVHMVRPNLRIDAVTLALVVVAIAPWLAPVFKSVELPGGWKFEYQEIQRQVGEVRRQIEHVERLLISGDVSPALENRLNQAVDEFSAYLRAVHPMMDVPPPVVVMRRGLDNARYDTELNQIQLDPDFAVDDYAIMREYAHHVLLRAGEALSALEFGLADYFIASFTGNPVLGTELARALRRRPGFERGFVRNLDNQSRLDPAQDLGPHAEGEIWGAAFWQLRDILPTPGLADRVLATAWFERPDDTAPAAGYPAAVIRQLEDASRPAAQEVFERRGLSTT
jgi:hypothetical protein